MKWLTTYGRPLVTERSMRKQFNSNLQRYRQARDNRRAHGILCHTLLIDGIEAELDLNEYSPRYMASLTMGDVYLRETGGLDRAMSIGARQELPAVMVDGLAGQKAEDVFELPAMLKPIIAGRIIERASTFDQWVTFAISSEPW